MSEPLDPFVLSSMTPHHMRMAIEKNLHLATAAEHLAAKNQCPPGVGPSLMAQRCLERAMAYEAELGRRANR